MIIVIHDYDSKNGHKWLEKLPKLRAHIKIKSLVTMKLKKQFVKLRIGILAKLIQ